MKKLLSIITIAALAPIIAAAPASAAETGGNETALSVIYQHTNTIRAEASKGKLKYNADISKVSQAWTKYLATSGKFYHNPDFFKQMPQNTLRKGGENIAYTCGYKDPVAAAESLVVAWKNSSGHYKNMVDSSFTDIGIGFYYDAKTGCAYATQNFGQYTTSSGTYNPVFKLQPNPVEQPVKDNPPETTDPTPKKDDTPAPAPEPAATKDSGETGSGKSADPIGEADDKGTSVKDEDKYTGSGKSADPIGEADDKGTNVNAIDNPTTGKDWRATLKALSDKYGSGAELDPNDVKELLNQMSEAYPDSWIAEVVDQASNISMSYVDIIERLSQK